MTRDKYLFDANDGLLKPTPLSVNKYVTQETAANEGGTALAIQSRVSTLLTDPTTGRAITQQPGISPHNKDNKNGSLPKLLFWNGLIDGKPQATNAHGRRSLLINGPNNLVDKGYRRFESFKADTFSINKLVYLSAADLALFNFRRKVHIRGVNYVVGSLKAVLGTNQNTIPTEVGMWRI